MIKKAKWFIKRHPFFYLMRFRLLSVNMRYEDCKSNSYNDYNAPEDIPAVFGAWSEEVFNAGNKSSSELERAKALCLWLNSHIKGGPGLSRSSSDALKLMLNGEGGVCSDLVQVFLNFAVVNNIQVREWGTTRIPFDQKYGGHSLVEVYDSNLETWVMLDVSYCMLFLDENGRELSVEHFMGLKEKSGKIQCENFGPEKTKQERLDLNYLHPSIVFFMIDRYDNSRYDRVLNRWAGILPTSLIHFLVYVRGKSYRYLFPFNEHRALFD